MHISNKLFVLTKMKYYHNSFGTFLNNFNPLNKFFIIYFCNRFSATNSIGAYCCIHVKSYKFEKKKTKTIKQITKMDFYIYYCTSSNKNEKFEYPDKLKLK